MTKLSVNINKIATLRNARGGNMPNVLEAARRIEGFGANGITVHPRPDERHITYQDVRDLAPSVSTEFNIEGNPNPKFIDLVLHNKPTQVTLVPDAVDAITSNAGWDTIKNQDYLRKIIDIFKAEGIRTSIFVDPNTEMVKAAKQTGVDRIELYTEAFAQNYPVNQTEAIQPYVDCANLAQSQNLGINAGHDLSLENISYFKNCIPFLDEVSIGHALISEALYLGLETVVKRYLKALK
ncbi:pyridoxine 5'-phosphate synthase [Psychroflexus sp. ALD_RP9]|uniref:pyridoxine 5'-phosphate synthase n=1 Tax=Psychroflexus sp. ALD_RP9 TaxID=2777186 RepID=UPI001A8F6578|nr:pyridoxine 5'-phosphate synthase [Psychroflexus sp. ALD_RP9]QSS96230.1 pyridoxine 5'-phosphate synthase [Psychroflexus sp. ALD_RP9]